MLLSVGLSVAGGALAARLEALRVYLVVISAAFLGLGYLLTTRGGGGERREKVLLWVATGVTVFFWALPYLFPILLSLRGD